MSDPDLGDRTSEWFWHMLSNLGLSKMNDSDFDKERAEFIVYRFLNREYEPNGEGGLFVIEDCKDDLRRMEIWYQANMYLREFL